MYFNIPQKYKSQETIWQQIANREEMDKSLEIQTQIKMES